MLFVEVSSSLHHMRLLVSVVHRARLKADTDRVDLEGREKPDDRDMTEERERGRRASSIRPRGDHGGLGGVKPAVTCVSPTLKRKRPATSITLFSHDLAFRNKEQGELAQHTTVQTFEMGVPLGNDGV